LPFTPSGGRVSDPIDDLSALRIERAPLESNRRGWGK
jgi:hypothetical protein